jgi:hypothetical protein
MQLRGKTRSDPIQIDRFLSGHFSHSSSYKSAESTKIIFSQISEVVYKEAWWPEFLKVKSILLAGSRSIYPLSLHRDFQEVTKKSSRVGGDMGIDLLTSPFKLVTFFKIPAGK